jgi:hypothetical protein
MHDPFPGRRVSRVEATEKAREREELAHWRSVFCLLWQGGLLRGSGGSIALGLRDSHRLQALLFFHPPAPLLPTFLCLEHKSFSETVKYSRCFVVLGRV